MPSSKILSCLSLKYRASIDLDIFRCDLTVMKTHSNVSKSTNVEQTMNIFYYIIAQKKLRLVNNSNKLSF